MSCFYPRPWSWSHVGVDIVLYDANGVPILSDGWCNAQRERAADWIVKLVNEASDDPPIAHQRRGAA